QSFFFDRSTEPGRSIPGDQARTENDHRGPLGLRIRRFQEPREKDIEDHLKKHSPINHNAPSNFPLSQTSSHNFLPCVPGDFLHGNLASAISSMATFYWVE